MTYTDLAPKYKISPGEIDKKKGYTALTFAPVQGFIEKSRKLRDLYGGSFLLSYLAKQVCTAARIYFCGTGDPAENEDPIISPALIDVTKGTPNQIIIKGYFPRDEATKALDDAWKKIAIGCREWIEASCSDWIETERSRWGECWQDTSTIPWQSDWNAWSNYAWEFFWGTGETVSAARESLNQQKLGRSWTGINWQGESSTLSGADAIAFPGMNRMSGKQLLYGEEQERIRDFYQGLSNIVGDAIIDPREELSIPELIKRLITVKEVAQQVGISLKEIPRTYRDLNRLSRQTQTTSQENQWTGWFQGDGDKIGDYLKQLKNSGEDEASSLHAFSQAMMNWGEYELYEKFPSDLGRIIYAGGDDFMGVCYHTEEQPILSAKECLSWFNSFRYDIWEKHKQPLGVSVGFVWAAPNVPQRDVLQHCRLAEKAAKNGGRDRLSLRVLFNDGKYLQWICPWHHLNILDAYCDRTGGKNWRHIYEDVAVLESRHAFTHDNTEIATSLIDIYFHNERRDGNYSAIVRDPEKLWNTATWKGGILGEETRFERSPDPQKAKNQAFNNWVINLAKVGFHLLGNDRVLDIEH